MDGSRRRRSADPPRRSWYGKYRNYRLSRRHGFTRMSHDLFLERLKRLSKTQS